MNKQELITELNKLDLVLKIYSDESWAVGTSRFANIMMAFNPKMSSDDYYGHVKFKIINARLFTGEQIKGASEILDTFLSTPLELRGIEYEG